MIVENISEANEKQRIARLILEALPEWFGIPEAREQYIQEVPTKPFMPHTMRISQLDLSV